MQQVIPGLILRQSVGVLRSDPAPSRSAPSLYHPPFCFGWFFPEQRLLILIPSRANELVQRSQHFDFSRVSPLCSLAKFYTGTFRNVSC